jgi:hypothetical protein
MKILILNIFGCILFISLGILILSDITKKFTTVKNFSQSNNYKLYFAGIISFSIGFGLLFYLFKSK